MAEGPTKAVINEGLQSLVDEINRRLSDPETLCDMTTGEMTQAVYALLAVRDNPENLALKKRLAKLKERFGDGTKTPAKARRLKAWSGRP